jgi:hypothetical protein
MFFSYRADTLYSRGGRISIAPPEKIDMAQTPVRFIPDGKNGPFQKTAQNLNNASDYLLSLAVYIPPGQFLWQDAEARNVDAPRNRGVRCRQCVQHGPGGAGGKLWHSVEVS